MATFGQLIPRQIFTVPRLGFYNFHHSDLMPHPVLCRMAGGRL
jgi:methionyl-tRNA formyltransferase